MANQHQLAGLTNVDDWNRWRQSNPAAKIDLSGANLTGILNKAFQRINLSGANLKGANLADCNLTEANLESANLSEAQMNGSRLDAANFNNADLSDTDCARCNFAQANLSGVKVTSASDFSMVNFSGAKVGQELLIAKIQGANFQNLDLAGVDLSGRDLLEVNFQSCKLQNSNFSKATLDRCTFASAQLDGAKFNRARLIQANLRSANLTGADLAKANVMRADLALANLDDADIAGADFFETRLDKASTNRLRGAYTARNLITTRVEQELSYFPKVIRNWPERWVDWEWLRVAGRLPLFGASYTGLIIIPIYIYALGIYNDKIEAMRTWLSRAPEDINGIGKSTANAVLAHLRPEPIPESFFLLFVSTIFLAIAATIYTAACPSRIKNFSRDQWCDELSKPLIHYWPEAWRWRYLRIACAIFYALGGAGALYVLATKLWYVGVVLFRSN
jgi:uncharacterized protein YjbI with pentapeptide repeats